MVMIKIHNDKQVKYFKEHGILILHRIMCFYKPCPKFPKVIYSVKTGNNEIIGLVRISFLEYGKEGKDFISQIKNYIGESGFIHISEWLDDIRRVAYYQFEAEKGAFYKLEKMFKVGS